MVIAVSIKRLTIVPDDHPVIKSTSRSDGSWGRGGPVMFDVARKTSGMQATDAPSRTREARARVPNEGQRPLRNVRLRIERHKRENAQDLPRDERGYFLETAYQHLPQFAGV
jgi:hypothetical protein